MLQEANGPDRLEPGDEARRAPAARGTRQAGRPAAAARPGRLVDLPAHRLYVRAAPPDGAGPPAERALFVHGLGGSSTNWTDLMDLLSRPDDRHPDAPVLDCVAVDLPGFGCSPPPADGDYTVTAHARAVTDLLDSQGDWPVHLVGNSMGGAVCTRVAALRPDLVRTLTLVSPAMPDLRPRLLPLRLALVAVPGAGRAIMNWLRRQPAPFRADQAIKDLYWNPGVVHPDRRQAEIAELRRRDRLDYADDAVVGSARSLVLEYFRAGPASLWRDAGRTRAPALILYGSHDKLVNPVMAAKAARAFPGGRVHVLARVGHVAMMERPAVVAEEVRSFIEAVRSGASVGEAAARG